MYSWMLSTSILCHCNIFDLNQVRCLFAYCRVWIIAKLIASFKLSPFCKCEINSLAPIALHDGWCSSHNPNLRMFSHSLRAPLSIIILKRLSILLFSQFVLLAKFIGIHSFRLNNGAGVASCQSAKLLPVSEITSHALRVLTGFFRSILSSILFGGSSFMKARKAALLSK